jgi:hypothetical protein
MRAENPSRRRPCAGFPRPRAGRHRRTGPLRRHRRRPCAGFPLGGAGDGGARRPPHPPARRGRRALRRVPRDRVGPGDRAARTRDRHLGDRRGEPPPGRHRGRHRPRAVAAPHRGSSAGVASHRSQPGHRPGGDVRGGGEVERRPGSAGGPPRQRWSLAGHRVPCRRGGNRAGRRAGTGPGQPRLPGADGAAGRRRPEPGGIVVAAARWPAGTYGLGGYRSSAPRPARRATRRPGWKDARHRAWPDRRRLDRRRPWSGPRPGRRDGVAGHRRGDLRGPDGAGRDRPRPLPALPRGVRRRQRPRPRAPHRSDRPVPCRRGCARAEGPADPGGSRRCVARPRAGHQPPRRRGCRQDVCGPGVEARRLRVVRLGRGVGGGGRGGSCGHHRGARRQRHANGAARRP